MKKTIVFSGINLFEAGPLSIYIDCLESVKFSGLWRDNKIIAFVHKKELFDNYKNIVKLIELPKSRKNYVNRLYYEYMFFYQFSCKNHIDIWISLHDITPRVKADKVYTYCHNPTPFMRKDISKIKYSWKVVLFSYFYKYLYQINIKSAAGIIVQQDWMRQQFIRMYSINNVIVARPVMKERKNYLDRSSDNRVPIFISPSYPRFFKNFEVLLSASKLLEKRGVFDFEVWITLDGTENKYSSNLKQKYENLRTVKWLGLMPRDELLKKYEEANYMVFPSILETWGLPISEFKATGKPMILADLPYAHETLGEYDCAMFFKPDNARELEEKMMNLLLGNQRFAPKEKTTIEKPYAESWLDLIQMIIGEG